MRRNSGSHRASRALLAAVTATLVAVALVGVQSPGASAKAAPQVLYVGAIAGITTPPASTFSTIQAAVDAAKKGDWILVAPGDYHETGDMGANAPTPQEAQEGWYGGVDITTADLHLRGMGVNRTDVMVDGTLASAPTPCDPNPIYQNNLGGLGRNGIVVWETKGVSIDNLTVCNFINGNPGAKSDAGNEIWWNGGAGSGKIGLKGYSGSYLAATSTYFASSDPSHINACATCALYGIFASNAKNGALSQLYANNFSDSGMYVGACLRACNVTVDHAWMENNALGYSGTNSGGAITITHSSFDNNKEGLDTNTALTGDPPPPQDGRCPGGATNPVTGTNSCWLFEFNKVFSNNNPNVPIAGTAGLGPTGTGMTVSGGRNDTILNNEFYDNGAWGVLFAPYPDQYTTNSNGKTCKKTGGILASTLPLAIANVGCLYDPEGNSLVNNQFTGNGTLLNAGNADYGNLLIGGNELQNCFSGNTEFSDSTFATPTGPATIANTNTAQTPATCKGAKTPKTGSLGTNTDLSLLVQAECDAGVLGLASCTAGGAVYPQPTGVVMQPLPPTSQLPTMNPCAGTTAPPTNLWCPGGVLAAKAR